MYTLTITTEFDTKIIIKTYSDVEKDELWSLIRRYFSDQYQTVNMTVEFSKE